ncbi:MAG: prepilin-type N-terminal cleavage/methylation domain-containing protein, partial [Phycisphaerae bacterium]|nr:prepilin-type N-terminal cleavage/methylation domain-containing protein [Gemmatimonadaceae bacterium]
MTRNPSRNRRSASQRRRVRLLRARSGFTLVELLLTMTVSMVILTSATGFAMTSWQSRRGWTIREAIDRNARFVGMSLSRDAQESGIAMESTPVFASVATFGDTLSILSVPYEPNESPVYSIYNDGGASPEYPPGGNCGATCIEFNKSGGTYVLAAGDMARLQVGGERRLLLLTNVTNNGTRFRVHFKNQDWMLGRQSALSDSLLLSRSSSSIQKLKVVAYYHDPSAMTLLRAETFNTSGQPIGGILATNVELWDASLLFVNNFAHQSYDGFDADTTNNGNKIIGVKLRAKLKADRVDPGVNGGQLVT